MSGLYRLYQQKVNPPADPTASFEGKEVIVTGSNTGLGFEAASKFAQLGASRVILGVRNANKGAAAKAVIDERLAAAGKTSRIEVWPLDMDSYDSVMAFAQRAESELPRLDAAVLNAGVYMLAYETSPLGWEETLQVNVLSTALLALLLLPKLRKTQRSTGETPTLEIVSSGRYRFVELSEEQLASDASLLEAFNKSEGYAGGRQYSVSKLFVMCVLGTLKDLAAGERDAPDVFCTAVCPGACKSELARSSSLAIRIGKSIFSLLQRSAEEGSRTLVSGIQLHEKGHGRFWQHDEIKPEAPLLAGESGKQLQQRVWREILEALKKDVPDVASQG